MPRIKPTDRLSADPKEPYEVEMSDGAVFILKNVKKLHGRKLLEFDRMRPADQLRALMGEDEYERFMDYEEVDGEFLEITMSDFRAYYGLGEPGKSII